MTKTAQQNANKWTDWLTELVLVPLDMKISYFRDVLLNQSFGMLLKKLKQI